MLEWWRIGEVGGNKQYVQRSMFEPDPGETKENQVSLGKHGLHGFNPFLIYFINVAIIRANDCHSCVPAPVWCLAGGRTRGEAFALSRKISGCRIKSGMMWLVFIIAGILIREIRVYY